MDLNNLEDHYIMSDSDDENMSRAGRLNIRKAKTLSKIEKQRSCMLPDDKNLTDLTRIETQPLVQEGELTPALCENLPKPDKMHTSNSHIS